MKTTRRNSKVYTLFRSLPTLPLAPFTTVAGTPLMGHVNGFGALWVTLMAVDAVGNPGSISIVGDDTDNQPQQATGDLLVVNRNYLYDGGVNWDRWRSASETNLQSQSGDGAAIVTAPGQDVVSNAPVAGTLATVTKAAPGAGACHVITSISFAVSAVAAAARTTITLSSAGSGSMVHSIGPVLIGDSKLITFSGLNYVAADNAAVTLAFGAAPAGTNFQSVAMTGYIATA